MIRRFFTYLSISLLTGALACSGASAADRNDADLSSQWDSAVSSLLLAAGMYGLDVKTDQGINPAYSSAGLFKTLPRELATLNNNNITLSYTGSSGRLDFSAGYLYTSMQDDQQPGTLFVGLDSPSGELQLQPSASENSWFLALDYSKAFQLNDNFALKLGSRAMLMKNPFDLQDGRILSMLLNLPMSYKNYFTLTPELQWSHTIQDGNMLGNTFSKPVETDNKDVFYGGMSISFSY